MAKCIVVFDDGASIVFPYGLDPDCEGGLAENSKSIAVFPNRNAAQRAIRISRLHNKLCAEQGLTTRCDWEPENREYVHILPAVEVEPAPTTEGQS